MKKLPFTGSGVALVTPFTNDNKIDFESLRDLIEMHIAHKTDAIIICGTTGEASAMPDEEHLAAIEFTVKQANGRIPVIAGTGSNDTHHAINLSKKAEELGADGLLSVTPYYNKANKSGVIAHFKAIAEAVSIPVILYNVPSRTGMTFSIDVLKELVKIDNIVGLKEASGNISYLAEVAATVPELYLYSGNDDMIVPVMSLGGVGVISVVANIYPDETHDICQLYADGKVAESRKLQLQMLDLINKLFIEVNPVPVKSAMKELGYRVGDLRLPLGEMDKNNLKTLMDALNAFGVKKLC